MGHPSVLPQMERQLVDIRVFDYVRVGYDRRLLELLPGGRIGRGGARLEMAWAVRRGIGGVVLDLIGRDGLTCTLKPGEDGVWRGRWLKHERMPVELVPLRCEERPVGGVPEAPAEPIDAVYLWVDGADPEFEARLHSVSPSGGGGAAMARCRFRNNGELRYSLRSVAAYAPWIRHIHVVTNGQVPAWLKTDEPGLSIVTHEQIFDDPSDLPTFNSHAIESKLHRIPDLAPRFIYFNDDTFLGRPVGPRDFIDSDGAQRVFLEGWELPASPRDHATCDRAYAHTLRLLALAGGTSRLAVAHVPQLYRVDILEELHRRWGDELSRTGARRFRSSDDAVMRVLYFHFVLNAPSHAPDHRPRVLRPLSSNYIFLMMKDGEQESISQCLDTIYFERPKFFCINDDLTDGPGTGGILATLSRFLESYYPDPCRFERLPSLMAARGCEHPADSR